LTIRRRNKSVRGTFQYTILQGLMFFAIIDFYISEYFQTGDYYVSLLEVYDMAQSRDGVEFADTPDREPIKKIYIETTDPDDTFPEIDVNRITIYAEPTHPEALDGETKVTINFYARDDKSGFVQCSYTLRDPQGIDHFQWFYHRNFYSVYFDGDPTVWERYTINCVLPKGSAPGIWGLASIDATDLAGNARTFNFVETLIFEPDDSNTDYVLFAEMSDDYCVNLKVSSETVTTFGINYRIINEETDEEISGSSKDSSNAKRTRAVDDGITVDVSSLPDGELVVIVNVLDENGEVTAVRTNRLTKTSTTGIRNVSTNAKGTTNVYNIQGMLIKRDAECGTWKQGLEKGVYIVNGQKQIVR